MIPDVKVVVTEKDLRITAALPGLHSGDLEITVEGRILRIVGKQGDGNCPFESKVDLPLGYDESQARAVYINGKLGIMIPPTRPPNQRIDFFQDPN